MPQLAEPMATTEATTSANGLFAGQMTREDEERRLSEQLRTAAAMSRAGQTAREQGAVVVDIYDQVYQLRGTDAAHIEKLAGIVDAKMRAVSAQGTTVDSLRVAVLAALNIADELTALRARYDALAGSANLQETSVRSRAGSLLGMLDEVLQERKAG
ncbi:MAG TPA: cell division protein ZapA [Candidatus Aquilonibacter sp.]|nr:cell division protein ZapA [Candidatus Aquilonibacter sp.]